MIGIVLWADPNDCKAVFWCEDHGDLAYYSAEFDGLGRCDVFAAGDMVQFDVLCDEEFRRALNPHVIQENACDGLERPLRSEAYKTPEPDAQPGSCQVVPFRRKETGQSRVLMRERRR